MKPPEMPEEGDFDEELLDEVSPWLRNQVLDELTGRTYKSAWSQWSKRKKIVWSIGLTLAGIWGMFQALVGIILCFTIVLIPIGVPLVASVGILPGEMIRRAKLDVSTNSQEPSNASL